VCNFVFITL